MAAACRRRAAAWRDPSRRAGSAAFSLRLHTWHACILPLSVSLAIAMGLGDIGVPAQAGGRQAADGAPSTVLAVERRTRRASAKDSRYYSTDFPLSAIFLFTAHAALRDGFLGIALHFTSAGGDLAFNLFSRFH